MPRSRSSKVIAVLLGSAAVALFLGLFAITQFGATASDSNEALEQITHRAVNVLHGIFYAGALPVTLAAYFWLYQKESSILLGLVAVTAAVFVHYLAVAAVAHGTNSAAALAVFVEGAFGVGTVAWAQRHLGRPTARKQR